MRRSRVLWLIPVLIAVHNVEEALSFPRYFPLVLARLPEGWRAILGPITVAQIWTILALVTLIPAVLAAWATLHPGHATPIRLLVLVQALLLLNVLWHLSMAIFVFRGYAPGVLSAVLLNLPFSVYLLRRAAREHWVVAA